MNYQYYSYPLNDYSTNYYPVMEQTSPVSSAYTYTSYTPSCPVHSSYYYYSTTTPSTTNTVSPTVYSDYTPPSNNASYTLTPPQSIPSTNIDRTPLRRHQCFKKNQLFVLHQAYRQEPHPSVERMEMLSLELNSTVEKVRQWFKNRRHSDKQKKRPNQSSK